LSEQKDGWLKRNPLQPALYRSPTRDAPKPKVTSEEIDAQVADFLARGGTIQQVEQGESNFQAPSRHLVIKKRVD